VGEFDATKQANVILLLRGERFAGCDLPEDSSRSTPQAATMTTSSQNWSNVGTQATSLADDLDNALKQLLKGWEGKAADEFSTNVTKVVAFARQIAHVADSDNLAPAADGTSNPFATSKSSTGYKQLFTGLASDVTTYTGTSKAPGLPWETGRWWWKWYATWSFNYEVRDDSGVVHGDINGDKFVDFMRDHGVPTDDAADGLVSHPLPKDWPASVKAFEAKEFNTDQQNDCRAAGNDLATKYKDFSDRLGDAPVAPTLSGSSGLPDTSGLGGTPGGGMPSRGMPTGGGGGGSAGGVSGGAPNFTPPHLTDTGGSGGSSGSSGSGGGLPGGSGGTGSGGVGTGGSWPGGSGSGGSGSSGSGGSGPVTGSGSSTYGGGSDGSGGGSYESGSGNYPGSGSGVGWNDGSTGIDTGGVLAGYDPGTDGSAGSGSGGYGSGGYGSGTPTAAGAGGFGSAGGLGTSAASGLSGSGAGGSSVGGTGSGASGSGGLAPGSVGGAGSAGTASGGGSGMMAPMMGGGGGGGGQESTHQTWLVEDEDVWGAREGETAPPVIGGSL